MPFQGILGLIALGAFAWVVSENRRRIKIHTILIGLIVQFALALIMLKIPASREIFTVLNNGVEALDKATTAGTSFVFGYLGGGSLPFDEKGAGASFIFAFKALPLVLVISALSSILFYWKILPIVVKVFSFLLQKTLKIGGAVALGAAANIFLGMVEAPLLIRPYLRQMTRSELFITMTCGMANIAGTVMVLYALILNKVMPEAMGHILVASILSTPAAIIISLMLVPETGEVTSGRLEPPQAATSTMDAIAKGTAEGLTLFLNIIAMLIVLVSLVALANLSLGLLPPLGGEPLTLQRILGYIMAPVAWLIGIPWSEAFRAGALLGTKTILNEFIAYVDLANLPAGTLNPRSQLIMIYALCGFANLGSLGILIGGLGAMAPERRDEIVGLGMKSILAGTMATLMVGAVIGLLV
ncbi:MAG: nucleoside:proton symporter [Deltaproteobacteria bacterium]|nr:nucleoside:proton symporter [Deltaproteobacteria bacterium]